MSAAAPAWLRLALDECAACALDNEDDRDRLAQAILARLTEIAPSFVGCIASAARAHFKTRGISDASGDLAKQIGANGATSILMLLES
jgi:hypothetical protein